LGVSDSLCICAPCPMPFLGRVRGGSSSAPSSGAPSSSSAPPPLTELEKASSDDRELSTDHCSPDDKRAGARDSGLGNRLQELLIAERTAHAETLTELQVERAAHDETAERMVEMQHKLEVTLQELANLERFVKRQQQVDLPSDARGSQVEKLVREEAYLKSRLVYVQQELGQLNSDGAERRRRPNDAAESLSGPGTEGAEEAEERVLDTALSI